jgi:hypothetical protein
VRVHSLRFGGGGSDDSGGSSQRSPTPSPTPTVTPAWLTSRAIGEWFQISGTALSSVDPSPMPAGNTGPQSKVIAWTSFVVDTETSKVYSVANGGHQDYAGNEVDELDLERAQPVWTQRLAPSPNSVLTNNQAYYSDGRPTSRHTYYGVTYNRFDNRIMLFGGGIWGVIGTFGTAISSYNIGTNQYSPSSTHGSVGSIGAGVAAYTADPLTGNVYIARNLAFSRWNRASNTVTVLSASGTPPDGSESMSAMDTTRGRILIAGGLSGDNHIYTIQSNTFQAINFTGAAAGNISGAGAAMIYVAPLDRFFVRKGGAGATVYQIHPDTWAVTVLPTTGGSPPSTQNGPYNKFLYVPRLGGVVYVPTHSGNAWFLRLH